MKLNELLTELGELSAKYSSGEKMSDYDIGSLLNIAYLLAGKVKNAAVDEDINPGEAYKP